MRKKRQIYLEKLFKYFWFFFAIVIVVSAFKGTVILFNHQAYTAELNELVDQMATKRGTWIARDYMEEYKGDLRRKTMDLAYRYKALLTAKDVEPKYLANEKVLSLTVNYKTPIDLYIHTWFIRLTIKIEKPVLETANG